MTTYSNELISTIVAAAHTSPSADNSQPWHAVWDGKVLALHYDAPRVSNNTFPATSPSTLLAIGAFIENAIVCAQSLGLAAELVLSSDPGAGNNYGHLRFHGTPTSQTGIPRDISGRHCNRGSYLSKPVSDDLIKTIEREREGSARCVILNNRDDAKSAAHLAKRASWIRFQTREVHQWLGRSLRFDKAAVARGDGLDVETLSLPPGGGSFLRVISDWHVMRRLNHIGAYRLLSQIDAAPLASAPAIVAVVAGTQPRDAIDAGRLLQRVWRTLNEKELAVHPYYVVADQLARLEQGKIADNHQALASDIQRETSQLLTLQKEETLHMMLRTGYAKKEAKRSLRVPVTDILTMP